MEIKCINNKINGDTRIYNNIKIGKTYIVLSIESNYNNNSSDFFKEVLWYRIIDENGQFMPCPSNLFEINSSTMPSSWIFNKVDGGYFELIPKEWNYTGFFEDYYNDDSKALEIFKEVSNNIFKEVMINQK